MWKGRTYAIHLQVHGGGANGNVEGSVGAVMVEVHSRGARK